MSETGKKLGKMYRFQDLEIWKKAIEIGDKLLNIVDELEKKRLYRFAEQIREARLSTSNNIAEGAGRKGTKEFKQYLNIAQGSISELDTQIELSLILDYLDSRVYDTLTEKINTIPVMWNSRPARTIPPGLYALCSMPLALRQAGDNSFSSDSNYDK